MTLRRPLIPDELKARKYDEAQYNCWDWTRDLLIAFNAGEREAGFVRIGAPRPLAIGILVYSGWRHCGLWLDGRFAHFGPEGRKYEPLERATIGAKEVRWYEAHHH